MNTKWITQAAVAGVLLVASLGAATAEIVDRPCWENASQGMANGCGGKKPAPAAKARTEQPGDTTAKAARTKRSEAKESKSKESKTKKTKAGKSKPKKTAVEKSKTTRAKAKSDQHETAKERRKAESQSSNWWRKDKKGWDTWEDRGWTTYKTRSYEPYPRHRNVVTYRVVEPPRPKAPVKVVLPIRHGRAIIIPAYRVRHFRHVVVVRPHGHWYYGYGHYYSDAEAYKWLAFTAITLFILDELNEYQQRAHEAAQIAATTALVGERVAWRRGGASGWVVPLSEGASSAGRLCREFEQVVKIGGREEAAYGTACQQPDGTWEIISTGS